MLLAAGHAKDDIPATLVREGLSHPDVDFGYGRALGIRPELLGLMDERISAVVPEDEKDEWAVLVVGRGSSDPDANSDLFKASRLFGEGRPYETVETAFVSMTPPKVHEGLERLRKLGAKKVAVFSYFLFTGVLEERIREQSEEFAGQNPDLEVRYAGYFGPDARVADLVLERYREAVRGDIRMNCDVCVHRVALPGFEEKVGAPATPHYHPDENGHDHSHGHDHHGHHHYGIGVAFEDRAKELAGDVIPPDEGAAERAGERHLALAKPPGSLGVIEDLGAKLAAISGKMPPPVPENAAGVVCAGDHGVLKRGVSPWPREVTAAMVAKAGPKSPESG